METALARPLPVDFSRSKEMGKLDTSASRGYNMGIPARSCEVKCLFHELRNYACTLKGNAILLRKHLKQGAPPEPLERMERTMAKMERLLEEILEAHKDPYPREWTSLELKAFLATCMAEHFPERPDALEIRGTGYFRINGDPRLLERVFMNLIRNAFEAGSRQIKATFQSKRGRIGLRLADDGCGCPEPDRERLFQPFISVGSKAGGTGTGLGLYIVRAIMKCHGGAIHAESPGEIQGRGMAFNLQFPKDQRRLLTPRSD